MSKSTEFQKDSLAFTAKADQEGCPPQKGQRIIYEGEEAYVTRINPKEELSHEER